MATAIDDNDADGQLDKLIWWLLSIRYTGRGGFSLFTIKLKRIIRNEGNLK